MCDPIEPSWWVVRTVPAREYRARDWAQRYGFTVWLPECEVVRVTRRQVKVTRRRPLFPGYMFVARQAAMPWATLDDARSIAGPLMSNGHVAVLPAREAAKLRALMAGGPLKIDENCRHRFAEGDRLRITGGAWQGHEGLFVARVKDRIKMLLDILGAKRQTLVPEALVEPA